MFHVLIVSGWRRLSCWSRSPQKPAGAGPSAGGGAHHWAGHRVTQGRQAAHSAGPQRGVTVPPERNNAIIIAGPSY